MPTQEEEQRKRNRTLLLCLQCRKRKVKCDRRLPCLSCIKHKTANECDYSGDTIKQAPNSDFADKINIFRMFADERPAPVPKTSSKSLKSTLSNGTANGHVPTSSTYPLSQAPSVSSPFGSHYGHPDHSSVSSGPGMLSELEALKLKVHQLEATLQKSKEPTPQGPVNPQMPPLDMHGNYHNVFQPLIETSLAPSTSTDNPTYVGINPYDVNDPDDVLDLYGGYNPIQWTQNRQMNYGPYSWLTIMKKDRALVILSDFLKVWGQNQTKSVMPILPKDATTSKRVAPDADDNHEEEFRQKAMSRDGELDLAPFTTYPGTINDMKIRMNQNAMALGLTFFEGEIDQKLHLIEKIRLMLPTQMSLWVLINRFFEHMYPFIPLIDESWFRNEIKRLLGPEVYREEKFAAIKVESRLDLAILGILLIVLRLSYLSTFSNNKADNERALSSSDDSPLAETKYILSHPIDIDVINLAQVCLDQFDLYRRTNITVLQCAVFMRIYHLFSPEEGDGSDGGDSHVFNNMCLQIAYCMGLNREPDQFEGLGGDGKRSNIGRKLWFYLKLMDMNQSFQYGFPMSVNDDYNDVLVPYYRAGNSNVLDANMEKAICEGLNGSDEFNQQLREILRKSLRLKDKMKMKELTQLLTKFECQLSIRFGSLSNFTNGKVNPDDYAFKKVLGCKFYMNAKSFLITMSFHFFLNYEKAGKHDLAFFYLRKFLAVACGECLPEYMLLIGNNHTNFDPNSTVPDLILSPSIEFLIHKTNQLNFAILIRINHTIAKLKLNLEAHSRNLLISFDYKLRYARLCKLSKLMEKFCKFSTSCLSRLSGRYYYAWRISKAHNYIIDLMGKPEFSEFLATSEAAFTTFTTEQLSELLLIADSTLWKIKSSLRVDPGEAGDIGITPGPDVPGGDNYHANGQQNRDEVELPVERPFKQSRTIPSGMFNSHHDVEKSRKRKADISPSSSLSFDLEDFAVENSGEIDQIWRQLTNINHRMEAESRQDIQGNQLAGEGKSKDGWIPLYLNNVPLQPFTPQTSGLDIFDNVYDFLNGSIQ